MMIFTSTTFLVLTHLFYAIDATNDVPTITFDPYTNSTEQMHDDDMDYWNQMAIGALYDENDDIIRTFGEFDEFDPDIGPLDELDGDVDDTQEWWDTQISRWESQEKYGSFEFDRSDPQNVQVQCEFCSAVGKIKGLCSWTKARGRHTTTQMNNHLITETHKATMFDNTIPQLREKKKKQHAGSLQTATQKFALFVLFFNSCFQSSLKHVSLAENPKSRF